MAYRIAAVDVHKKMVAVVVADVEVEGEYQFDRRKFGATPDQLRLPLRLATRRIQTTPDSPNACSDLCPPRGAKFF